MNTKEIGIATDDAKSPTIRRLYIEIDVEIDWRFFAILPALNINIHSRQIEFEWLFIGVYAGINSNKQLYELFKNPK